MAKNAKTALIIISAMLAGVCNSLIGAGGGIILSLALGALASEHFSDKKYIYVNSQASMIPGCALSCILYSMSGHLPSVPILSIALPAIIGGALGGIILPKARFEWLKAAFAVFAVWSGVRMIIA